MDRLTDVGVLDKAVAVLDAIEAEPRTLAELVDTTGLSRATAHRLATALETHRFVARDGDGRFTSGPRLVAPDLARLARPARTSAGTNSWGCSKQALWSVAISMTSAPGMAAASFRCRCGGTSWSRAVTITVVGTSSWPIHSCEEKRVSAPAAASTAAGSL